MNADDDNLYVPPTDLTEREPEGHKTRHEEFLGKARIHWSLVSQNDGTVTMVNAGLVCDRGLRARKFTADNQ